MNIYKVLKNITRLISLLCFVFMLLHFFMTGKVAVWNFPASIPPILFLVIPVLLFIIELIWKKKKVIGIVSTLLSILIGSTQVDINMFPTKSNNTTNKEIDNVTIFNWNTQFWDQGKNTYEFYQFLKQQEADIYILQEYSYFLSKDDHSSIDNYKLFPVTRVIPGFTNVCIEIDKIEELQSFFPEYYIKAENQFIFISRFPIKEFSVDESDQYAIADIEVYNTTIRFFNIHMLLHIEPTNPFKGSFYEALDRRFAAREIGFENLNKDIQNLAIDYLICGDFNSTKAMGVLDPLLVDNIDLAKYSKELLPASFNYSGMKLWRFDYAFVNKNVNNFTVVDYEMIDHENLSDHNPIRLMINVKD